jgi:acyl-CoA thioester hydrolase
MEKIFSIKKKMFYHDTDAGGVVYYANYLKYLEEGRTEALAELGIKTRDLTEQGIWFVVARVEVDYKSPARYQDVIEVNTRIEKVGRSSIEFGQKIKIKERDLILAKVILVCVNQQFRPISIPKQAKEALV